MRADAHQKVTADISNANAYLYVRQSTIRQVLENTESTKRQYALCGKMPSLWVGQRSRSWLSIVIWAVGRICVDREGFQKLVAEVGMGKAGIVLG